MKIRYKCGHYEDDKMDTDGTRTDTRNCLKCVERELQGLGGW